MKYTVNFIGRNALLLLILVGLVGMSSAYAGSQQATPQNTAKPKPAAQNTMKPKTSTKMAKTRTTRASKKKDITLEEAQQRALRKVPGTVESSQTMERNGMQIYSFEIRDKKGKTKKVNVDQTGKIVHR